MSIIAAAAASPRQFGRRAVMYRLRGRKTRRELNLMSARPAGAATAVNYTLFTWFRCGVMAPAAVGPVRGAALDRPGYDGGPAGAGGWCERPVADGMSSGVNALLTRRRRPWTSYGAHPSSTGWRWRNGPAVDDASSPTGPGR